MYIKSVLFVLVLQRHVKPVNSRDVGGSGCSQQELRVVQSSAGARESLPEL